MSLSPGTPLGAYQIVAPIGAGGMGEVYRATDTRLGRAVALKLLPRTLATDPERLARFEREARLLASLNHPGIAHLYGFETATIEDGSKVHLIAMELVEGEELASRITRGAIPPDEAITIAKQIAEALEEAHEKGIVHRDLKPANIKLTPDGKVKVLDFGLAKAWTGDGTGSASSPDVSHSPTMTRQGTEAGIILGTAAYMSPEQARGKAVDKRADIWAFGVVVFEMLTGKRLFAGETVSDVLAAVLTREPAWTALPSQTPGRVREVLRRCLERNPKQRLHDIADARILLEEAPIDGAPAPAPSRSAPLLAALALLALVAAGLAWKLLQRPAPAPHILSFAQVTDQPGIEAGPSLSPDGKSVVYAKAVGTNSALYVLRIGSRNPVRLTQDSSSDDVQPAFSPDGEQIAFRSGRDGGGLFLMSASGESVTRLTDFGFSPSWSPDGSEIVVALGSSSSPTGIFVRDHGLSVVNVQTKQVRKIPVDERALQPAWSPGGSRIAYWGVRGTSGQRDIWTVAADGSDAAGGGVAVTHDHALDWSPAWSPDGRYLYFSSTRGGTMNLWRVPIDERSGHTLGEPEPVTTPSTWSGNPSFSRDGSRLAFASLDYRSTLLRVGFDAARETLVGMPMPIVKGTHPIRDHELSPDGEWIAFTEAGVREDLFVARVDGSQYTRLTDDAFRDRGPSWSPDGTLVAFYSDRSGGYDLWTIKPDGSALTALTAGSAQAGWPAWSPDGNAIAFGFDRWFLVNPKAGSTALPPEQPVISPTERFLPTAWSPDGARIAGQVLAANGSDFAVILYSVATKTFAPVPGPWGHANGWLYPVWLADSRRLLVRSPAGIAVVNPVTGAGHSLVTVGGEMVGHSVGITRDDRWITYTETATEGDIWVATIKADPSP